MPSRVDIVDVILPLAQSEDEAEWRRAAASKLGLPLERIADARLRKHSIDARQRAIKVQLRLEVGVDGPLPSVPPPVRLQAEPQRQSGAVVIVGCGPAGMFAALRCLELGLRPIVLERG